MIISYELIAGLFALTSIITAIGWWIESNARKDIETSRKEWIIASKHDAGEIHILTQNLKLCNAKCIEEMRDHHQWKARAEIKDEIINGADKQIKGLNEIIKQLQGSIEFHKAEHLKFTTAAAFFLNATGVGKA